MHFRAIRFKAQQWRSKPLATLAIARAVRFQGAAKSIRLLKAEIIEKR